MAKKKSRKHFTLLQLIEEKVDIRKLLDSVYINEDELVQAALDQPDFTRQASRFRVQCMYKRAMLEQKLETERATVARKFRRIRDAGGRKEFTNDAVKERVELDPKVVDLRRKVDEAYALEELSKGIESVFRTRSDSLRIIANLGRISVHVRELELLRRNKSLRKMTMRLRESWQTGRTIDAEE